MTGITDYLKIAIVIAKYTLVILMVVLMVFAAYFMNVISGTSQIKDFLYNFPILNNFTAKIPYLSIVFPEVKYNADPWYGRVVTPGEMESTGWINAFTNKSDKFVADIFGAELIMGMTTRVSTVGGDWANAPNPVKVMSDTNRIYTTSDPGEAYQLAKEDNCSYVFLPNRDTFSGYDWVYGDHNKFEDPEFFQLMYENPDVKIYKVL